MKIAITGISGFLGSYLFSRFTTNSNYDVLGLSTTHISDNVVKWEAVYTPDVCADIVKDYDVIIHNAAYIPSNHNDFNEAKQCYEVNALGTLNLLKGCKIAGVNKFVLISGSNIFKPLGGIIVDDGPLGCEHSPYYLGSKVVAEIYTRAESSDKFKTQIIRPSSIYGRGMKKGMIMSMARKLLAGETVYLENNGQFMSDLLYVEDCVDVIETLIVSESTGNFNIGSGIAVSVHDVAVKLASILRVDNHFIKLLPPSGETLKGFYPVDISKLVRIMNFSPIQIEDGLKNMFK